LAFSAAVVSNNSGPSECAAYNFWCLKPGPVCLKNPVVPGKSLPTFSQAFDAV